MTASTSVDALRKQLHNTVKELKKSVEPVKVRDLSQASFAAWFEYSERVGSASGMISFWKGTRIPVKPWESQSTVIEGDYFRMTKKIHESWEWFCDYHQKEVIEVRESVFNGHLSVEEGRQELKRILFERSNCGRCV